MVRAGHLTLRLPQGRAADAALAAGVFAVVAVGGARSLFGERAEPWAVTATDRTPGTAAAPAPPGPA
ncbi:hypothetical protein [Streptomyces uncialis]|uniref:hypothetical protein n=1 Tax=Streptomyces uncialis TaxID=1048205 RepID=UPI0033E55CF6